MPIYGEDSYENCLIELFSEVLGYSHVYGPNVERDLHSPLYNSVLEEFEKLLTPIYEKIGKNNDEILRLTALRDELLPMLMNGQVSVE